MSLKAILDIVLHFKSFRNINLYEFGVYCIKSIIYQLDKSQHVLFSLFCTLFLYFITFFSFFFFEFLLISFDFIENLPCSALYNNKCL